ncbi:response regulator [Cellulophaga baltica]|uniref:response regulator n=1 Tax=Cellulophaga TaxID=104264 RepID=UPI001C069CAF|nr:MULTISPECIES: response regulator [Cellulophaga]MBU2995270.1 response regulator [Cellulophaga baltica]MDO6766665.1 response regulator [Cellulophaga sp. 1_MG-2023]
MKFEILLVDDDPIVQFLHKSVLIECNLPDQKLFSNGELVLNYIIENKDNDTMFLILLDINMPIMNGWEFLEQLRSHVLKPILKVIIVTSSIDSVDKEKAKKYPEVFEFFEKPLENKMILALEEDDDLKSFICKS